MVKKFTFQLNKSLFYTLFPGLTQNKSNDTKPAELRDKPVEKRSHSPSIDRSNPSSSAKRSRASPVVVGPSHSIPSSAGGGVQAGLA